MSEFWQRLLMELAVSFLGGLLGGGAISAYLDWRRFRREQAEIRKEEQRIAIDSVRSAISLTHWRLSDEMSDKEQLYILKHSLQDSVREYVILAEFAILNLTDDEVIVTKVEAEEPGLPPFDYYAPTDEIHEIRGVDSDEGCHIHVKGADFEMYDIDAFYDWKAEQVTQAITLPPKGTFGMAYIAVHRFCAIRKLVTPPKSVRVTVHSTGGHRIAQVLELTEERVPRDVGYVGKYPLPEFSREWYLRMVKEAEEISF